MKYTEQAVETLDDAGSVIANKNIEIKQLRQRVAELTAERDEYKGKLEDEIVDHDCHRTELTAWATKYRESIAERDALKLVLDSACKVADQYRDERNALKQQRDELMAALEQFVTWGRMQHKAQSKGCHATFDMMALKDEIDLAEAAIASVKEKS